MTDDTACLRKYAETRDESAFAEFVRRNLDFVYSAALRQTDGDAHSAEDIAQKVFVAAAQKAATLARHPVVAAWLHQTTRYAAIDVLRSRRRRLARERAAEAMTETIAEPEVTIEWDQLSPELDKIIASLGARDREAIILRFFGGKSFSDLGAQLHLSEGAARMRVERALEKLRSRLARKGITSSCAALATILAENSVTAAPAGLGTAVTAAALVAPVGAGVATVLGTLQIMTSTKITLGVATLVTLVSLAAAVHEYRHARSSELTLAAATSTAPAARRAIAQASPPLNPPSVHAADSAATKPSSHPANPFSSLLDLLSNPAIQKQNELLAKIRLDGQYSALLKNLKLTPAQIDQFKNLLVEKEMVAFDSVSAAHEQGIDARNDKAFFQVIAEAEKTVDAQISALLGPDAYSQFQQYQNDLPARTTSSLLAQALSYTAAPLTEVQANSVIQILTQYGTPALPPRNPMAVLNGDLGIISLNEQGLAQIKGILSPPQVQALQAKLQQQLQLLRLRSKMGP